MVPVSCNGCRACCMGDLIVLHPENGDSPEEYDCEVVVNPITRKPVFALRRNEKNECVYLGPDGCTIHDRAPTICREFDCRRFFLGFSRTERRMMVSKGIMTKVVFDAGRARVHTLDTKETSE